MINLLVFFLCARYDNTEQRHHESFLGIVGHQNSIIKCDVLKCDNQQTLMRNTVLTNDVLNDTSMTTIVLMRYSI